MYCFRCGTLVPDGQRFCGSCGTQVSDPGGATVAVAAAPKPESLVETLRRHLAEDYEVERELGRGGMAVVYKAVERELRRPVALKVLPPEMAHTASIAERFKREARLAASLDHPNIIPVYRVGAVGGTLFIAMKMVEGRALDTIIEAQGPLPVPVVVQVMRAATAALAFAHEKGVIHRDVKGGNILVETDGRVLVSDFGIARAAEEAALTASGAIVGTPHFMSPEQCAGLPLGAQCDQYSLGVVAFQMLSGEVPFDAETLPAIMQHHFFTPVPELGPVRDDVPPALEAVIRRALAKQPEDRYATTREMLAALDAVPVAEAERRKGEAMLRDLARGAAVGRISAGKVVRQGTFGGAPAGRSSGASPLPAGPPTLPATSTPGGPPPRTPLPAGRGATRALEASPFAPYDASAAASADHPRPSRPSAARTAGLTAFEPGAARRLLRRAGIALVFALFVVAGLTATRPGLRRAVAGRMADRELARAATLYSSGRREAAKQLFAKVAGQQPRLALPHVYLARIAREEGDVQTAGRELDLAVRLEPRSVAALREMGNHLLAAGNYEGARAFYGRALRVDPADRASQGYLGCTLVRLGRRDEGARMIAQAGAGSWTGCVR
jgi:tetratricopeptide (TPR) repeat protein/predicted Ser/Thr protein kinase